MLIRRDYRNQIFATLSLCLEDGVMMTPKYRLSTLIFTRFCYKKSFLIKIQYACQIKNLTERLSCEVTAKTTLGVHAGLSLTYSLMKRKFCHEKVSFAAVKRKFCREKVSFAMEKLKFCHGKVSFAVADVSHRISLI